VLPAVKFISLVSKNIARFERSMADAKTTSPPAVPNLNVAIVGHVAAGKSTLAGQLILSFGGVDSGTIDEYRAEAEKHDKVRCPPV